MSVINKKIEFIKIVTHNANMKDGNFEKSELIGTIIDKIKLTSQNGNKTGYLVQSDKTNEVSVIEPHHIKKIIP